jgi:hypothetical protein
MGALFFKIPERKATQVTLYVNGIATESGDKIPAVRVVVPLTAKSQQAAPQQQPDQKTDPFGNKHL